MAKKHHNKWEAKRHRRGSTFYIGLFPTREEAEAAEAEFDEYDPPAYQSRLRKKENENPGST